MFLPLDGDQSVSKLIIHLSRSFRRLTWLRKRHATTFHNTEGTINRIVEKNCIDTRYSFHKKTIEDHDPTLSAVTNDRHVRSCGLPAIHLISESKGEVSELYGDDQSSSRYHRELGLFASYDHPRQSICNVQYINESRTQYGAHRRRYLLDPRDRPSLGRRLNV